MQSMYRITVERMNDAGDWRKRTDIVFTTEYKIDSDLAEWVKSEIDTNATVTGQCDNCLDPDNGIHAIDCSLNATNIATGEFQERPIDREKCPVTKSAHIPVTEMGVTTCEECAYVLTSVWHAP